MKEILVAENGGACVICGYNKCPRALHFHHPDPAKKNFHVTSRRLSSAREEIKQAGCILICANCHMEIMWEQEGETEDEIVAG